MAYETIELERRGGAAIIRLNRPDALNAFNGALRNDLADALDKVAADDEVRAVCITGAGRAFSSGADLKDVGSRELTAEGHPNLEKVLVEDYHPMLMLIREMPKPVVAAVNGPAVGIGCSVALTCDLVLAHESSYFLLAFVNIGLVPDGGSSLLVPSRAGMGRAAEMAMLGEKVPAEKALHWGLCNRVLSDAEFQPEVDALVDKLATGPTKSYAGTKRQLNHWQYTRMADQLALEASIQNEMGATGDFAEGVMAFIEKRPTAFEGH